MGRRFGRPGNNKVSLISRVLHFAVASLASHNTIRAIRPRAEGTAPEGDMSGMIQVYDLATFEPRPKKPTNEWFLFHKDGSLPGQLITSCQADDSLSGWEIIQHDPEPSVSPSATGDNPVSATHTPQGETPLGSVSSGSISDSGSDRSMGFCNLDITPITKPSRPWRNPNPTYEPVYSNRSRNIFIALQGMAINNSTSSAMKEIQFSKTMPPPDDMQVQPVDSRYLIYFVTEMPRILGSDRFFPTAMTTIYQQSMNEPVLRHSILALSSWMTDNRHGRTPLYSLQHVQSCLPEIQKAIINCKISTAHILAVNFLSWLALVTGDLETTHRHLNGLFLMFVDMRHLSSLGEPSDSTDPNLMFLYRTSIKIDNTLAYRNFPLAYPPLTNHEKYHQQWLRHFIPNQSDIDLCIASFKLDDFTNQICHLHYAARQLRRKIAASPMVDTTAQEAEIQIRAKLISEEHKAWLSLPEIQPRIQVDNGFPVVGSQQESRFLHYPEYQITDPAMAQMLLIHASIGIHLSIVMTGKLGDYPRSRHDDAVLICRIYAALGGHSTIQKTGQSREINALWLAGLVLGNDCYPAGQSVNL